MGRRLVDAGIAGGELGPAEDVPAADHHRQLDAVLGGLGDLPGDVDHGVHGDAAFAGMGEALAGNLEHDAAETRRPIRPSTTRATTSITPWAIPNE